MTTLSEEQLNELSEQLGDTTLEDLLLICIRDTGLMDTVCMLDMMAKQTGQRIAMFNWKGRTFPASIGDLAIPAPDWKNSLKKSKEIAPHFPLIREDRNDISIDDETIADGEKDNVEESCDTEPKETEQSQVVRAEASQNFADSNEKENDVSQSQATENDGGSTKPIGD